MRNSLNYTLMSVAASDKNYLIKTFSQQNHIETITFTYETARKAISTGKKSPIDKSVWLNGSGLSIEIFSAAVYSTEIFSFRQLRWTSDETSFYGVCLLSLIFHWLTMKGYTYLSDVDNTWDYELENIHVVLIWGYSVFYSYFLKRNYIS